MRARVGEAGQFLAKAEEARLAAATMKSTEMAGDLLVIASAYERLADWVASHPEDDGPEIPDVRRDPL